MIPATNINRLASLNTTVSSPARYSHSRSSIRRQLDFQVEAIPVNSNCIFVGFKVPAYADFAVPADVLRVRGRDVSAGDGSDFDALPAWLGGREAADVGVDPVADCAEGVVVCRKRY
jgi:hypothetical protein